MDSDPDVLPVRERERERERERPTLVKGLQQNVISPLKTRKMRRIASSSDSSSEQESSSSLAKLQPDDEIIAILAKRDIAGIGAYYQVKIKRGGRRMNVAESALAEYPELLEDFESGRQRVAESSDHGVSEGEDGFEGSDSDSQDEQSDTDASEIESDSEDPDASRDSNRKSKSSTKKKHASRDQRPALQPSRQSERSRGAVLNYAEGQAAMDSDSEQVDSSSSDIEMIVPAKPTQNKPKINLQWGKKEHDHADLDSDEDERQFDSEDDATDNLANHRRPYCEKCGQAPALELLKQQKRKGKKRGRKSSEEESRSDILARGAWVECGDCCVAYHYTCLPRAMQAAITQSIKAESIRAQLDSADDRSGSVSDGDVTLAPSRVVRTYKRELDVNERIMIPQCTFCQRPKGTHCSVCRETKAPDEALFGKEPVEDDDTGLTKTSSIVIESTSPTKQHALPELGHSDSCLFRCISCKRASHYQCLAREENDEASDDLQLHVAYYQQDWTCLDCARWTVEIDIILAWKLGGTVAGDPVPTQWTRPDVKDQFADAEYLVKFKGDSYRHLEWIPHAFLSVKAPVRLRHFLAKGDVLPKSSRVRDEKEDEDGGELLLNLDTFGRVPNPDAKSQIPADWYTIDRIIDVRFKGSTTSGNEARPLPDDPHHSLRKVEMVFVKWKSLPYSQCTWDVFNKQDTDWDAYVEAYADWLQARKVKIPKLDAATLNSLDLPRNPKAFRPMGEGDQPDYIGGPRHLQLMPFQRLGVDWLYYKWWIKKPGVLSDEMGLGKTVQVISFLSALFKKEAARPFLIVVPNSTIGNWIREFATWAPKDLRVVPYFGDSASRAICAKYDLFNKNQLKAHAVITTYESVTKDVNLFRQVQRYEALIVDEAQRLKAGSDGLLFKALQTLTIGTKILLTDAFDDLDAVKAEYEDLTPEKVHQLQELLKPYFLRRTKEDVLDLPPLTEIILPVSLRPLQKKWYKDILEHNIKDIAAMTHGKGGAKSLNNILIQLRKICQSPYIYSEDIEPDHVTPEQRFTNFVDASGKFSLLVKLLPRLLARGHRILVFTQFLSVLDLMARFLDYLNVGHTSLSGSSTQSERQDSIDAFNAPDSDLKVFCLTTRAGGVGINLTSADCVILFDQDFNPMMDLQAIARAHRIGQTKAVVCYKLICKNTCEEKILAASKKKMVLEHLIVSKMSAEEGENADIEATLQFGAMDIMKEDDDSDITYTDAQLDLLLTTVEEQSKEAMEAKKDGKAEESKKAFSFAQVWEADKNMLGAVEDDVAASDAQIAEARSFWDQMLIQQQEQQAAAERARAANLGRGKRERKQLVDLKSTQLFDDPGSPEKGPAADKDRRRRKTRSSSSHGDRDADEYRLDNYIRVSSSEDDIFVDPSDKIELGIEKPKRRSKRQRADADENAVVHLPDETMPSPKRLCTPPKARSKRQLEQETSVIPSTPVEGNFELSPATNKSDPLKALFGDRKLGSILGKKESSSQGSTKETREAVLTRLEKRAERTDNPRLAQVVAEIRQLKGRARKLAISKLTADLESYVKDRAAKLTASYQNFT